MIRLESCFIFSVQNEAEDDVVHQGIKCDGCEMNPIKGLRYECLDCHDYDLCERCYNKEKYGDNKMGSKAVKGNLKGYRPVLSIFLKIKQHDR